MMDYPIEESVVLLKRARWFQDYLKVGTGRAPRRPPPPPPPGGYPWPAGEAATPRAHAAQAAAGRATLPP